MASRLLLLFAVFSITCSSSVYAARFSGEYLLTVCGMDKNGEELTPGGHIACQAYISGVLDYHNLIHSLGTAPSVDFCVPEDASLNQLQMRVSRYLYEHKNEHAKFTAAPGVALALFDIFPCKGASVSVKKPR